MEGEEPLETRLTLCEKHADWQDDGDERGKETWQRVYWWLFFVVAYVKFALQKDKPE